MTIKLTILAALRDDPHQTLLDLAPIDETSPQLRAQEARRRMARVAIPEMLNEGLLATDGELAIDAEFYLTPAGLALLEGAES